MGYREAPRVAGGVVTKRELERCGWDAATIRRMVRRGHLKRIRPGWFATPTADPALVAVVKACAAVTCVTALAHHDIWIPLGQKKTHRRASEHHSRGKRSGEYCSAYRELSAPRVAVDPLLIAFACSARCTAPDEFVAICDSVLHRHPELAVSDLREALEGAPRRVLRLLDQVDRRAESGTESLVRVRLRRRNIKVEIQVIVPGVGRVDLLVGRSLLIEVDSRAHHGGENYQKDRTRDQIARAAGYDPIRLTWEDVMFRWPQVEARILAMVRRGDHLGRRLAE
ncbi:type IV toxin-antitoxin system AbiEi family antitoxin domain-containing protein [Tsukamurella sp. 8F]|uniref:type IV toxin-antitoxin system AbiEi family antitoxin domain-containing protein n=1 Tax=unclassified Tsukamurella TaxID=2633480 RepID=UPI0023B89F94|nr:MULTISPECIES: type IV toxin-antitoxin system AbiEi family antitoxin domain-containing protein [unclassified Tsukamurella]MDF0530024.1 type IV toxin-antitoxin system AbiEi family antitoxin domain-containing protein [Tsukamurella sp. 8J]MDF0587204.1 type IV toxin-antitoxin system AbiEi family antitoxin domain-containing protein [Tsukamurella sp. 8F]